MTADHDQSASQNNPKLARATRPTNATTNPKNATSQTDWTTIGEIVGAFGIHGEIKVRPLTDFADRFAFGASVYLGDSREKREITASRAQGMLYIVGLQGCESANDAERLRGKPLYIPDSELAQLPPDQFYQHDIIGLRVENMDGRELGVITDIIESGSSDLYVIRDQAGGERMLPAVREFIHDVDLTARVMRVTPIPGLFDDNAEEAK